MALPAQEAAPAQEAVPAQETVPSQEAASAQEAGRFADELVKVPVRVDKRKGAAVESKEVLFESDELVRADSSLTWNMFFCARRPLR